MIPQCAKRNPIIPNEWPAPKNRPVTLYGCLIHSGLYSLGTFLAYFQTCPICFRLRVQQFNTCAAAYRTCSPPPGRDIPQGASSFGFCQWCEPLFNVVCVFTVIIEVMVRHRMSQQCVLESDRSTKKKSSHRQGMKTSLLNTSVYTKLHSNGMIRVSTGSHSSFH